MRHNLSEILEVIKDRRSIKPEQFSNRKVHQEIIEDMLNAAKWAPTHAKTQPWRFTVFMEEGLKRLSDFQSTLYKDTAKEFSEKKYLKLKERPLLCSAVIALGMKRQDIEKIPEIEEVAAVACAVQNMCLVSTAYGIGSYWGSGGVTYMDETKTFLNLSEKDKVMGFLYVGYPDIEWPKGQRRPLEYYTEWINH